MNGAELFRDFWWLMFPVFGMLMGVFGMFSHERRSARLLDLIKSYVDQGKEPPPELLRLAAQRDDEVGANTGFGPGARQNTNGWSFVVFAALAAGFGVGWYFVHGQGFAFAFLIVAVTMGVMAVGALVLAILGRK